MNGLWLETSKGPYIFVPEHVTHLQDIGDFGTRIFLVGGQHVDVPDDLRETFEALKGMAELD